MAYASLQTKRVKTKTDNLNKIEQIFPAIFLKKLIFIFIFIFVSIIFRMVLPLDIGGEFGTDK